MNPWDANHALQQRDNFIAQLSQGRANYTTKPAALRDRLQSVIDQQSATVTAHIKRESAANELKALLDDHPQVARILELIEELGL